MARWYVCDSDDNVFTDYRFREQDTMPPDPPKFLTFGWRWVKEVVVDPSFDSETEVKTGPVETVTFDEWRKVSTVRAKTSAELDDEADADADRIFVRDKTLKALSLVILDEINLLRVEHSLPARTAVQLRNAVSAKRRGL